VAASWLAPSIVVAGVSLIAAVPLGQTRPPQGVTGSAMVVGKVIDTRDRPITYAQVDLNSDALPARTDGGHASLSVLTNEDGDFVFTGLPAGFYRFIAYKGGFASGFIENESGKPVYTGLPLAAGERRVDLRIRMRQLVSVTGTITDEAGAPIRYSSVAAYRRRVVSGRPQFQIALSSTNNDDRGVYRLSGIEPGPYVLVASSGVRLTLVTSNGQGVQKFVYSTVTRPSARSDGAIEPMTLTAGQELNDLDFRLMPEPAVRVSGVVTGGAGSYVHLMLDQTDGVGLQYPLVRPPSALAQQDGRFTFEAVRPGRYVLRALQRLENASLPAAPQTLIQTASGASTMYFNLGGQSSRQVPQPLLLAETTVTVASTDVEDLRLSLRPGPQLSGRIVFDGTTPLPSTGNRYGNVGVILEPIDSRSPQLSLTRATIENGRVSVPDLGYGRYILRAADGSPWILRSAMAAGKDLTAEPFDVGTTDLRDVVFTFSDRKALIGGVVTGAATLPSPITVILFPANPRRWVDYGQDLQRVLTFETNADGTYLVSPLPGDHYILATSSDLGDAWTLPANLQRLAALADRASVSEGERLTINLRVKTIGR
jgi:protocatechuate 3,4-dioxygenase beta subunit